MEAISQTNELTKKENQKKTEKQLGVINKSIESLELLISQVKSYLSSVISGKVTPNKTIGRKLVKLFSSLPPENPQIFRNMFNDSIQDLLLVVHLSNLTQTQLQVAEKINQFF